MSRKRFPIPNLLNGVLSVMQLAVSLGLLAVMSRTASWVFWASAVAFAFVMQMGFSLIHEAQHNKLHAHSAVNEGLGILLAAMFPGSFQFMKVAHLAHHRRNRSDAELVDYILPNESRLAKWTQYYALVCGLVWLGVPLLTVLISLVPWSVVRRRAARNKQDELAGGATNYLRTVAEVRPQRVRLELIAVGAFWLLAVSVLHLEWRALWVAYAAFGFSWASQQYVYHIRTPRHLVEGALNLKLWAPLRLLYLNFNYHLEHHRAPGVSWIYMPGLAKAPASQPYWVTYLRIWPPPQPVSMAYPQDFQARGALATRTVQ